MGLKLGERRFGSKRSGEVTEPECALVTGVVSEVAREHKHEGTVPPRFAAGLRSVARTWFIERIECSILPRAKEKGETATCMGDESCLHNDVLRGPPRATVS